MLQELLFVLIGISLISCSSVEIKDHEWCSIAGIDGAFCFHTLSEKERDLTHAEWHILSKGWIAGSPEAYGHLKEVIEILCKQSSRCTYEVQKKIEKFFMKVKEAHKKAKE